MWETVQLSENGKMLVFWKDELDGVLTDDASPSSGNYMAL